MTIDTSAYRPLGTTGLKVSPLCLGAMMFGASATPTTTTRSGSSTARSTPASTSSTPPTSTPPASRRRSSARRSQGRRDDVVLATKVHGADGRGSQPAGQLAALDHPRGRGLPAPARHRLHRPLPDAPPRPGHRHRRDPRRAHRPRARRARSATSARRRSRRRRSSRRSGPPSARHRERPVTEQPPYSMLARGIEREVCPRRSGTAWACSPRARSRAAGCPASTAGRALNAGSAASAPARAARPDQAGQRRQVRRRRRARTSPTRPGCRWSTWHWRSWSAPGRHVGDHRPAHDGAPGVGSSPRTASRCPRTCSTASTRSSARRDDQRGRPGVRTSGPHGRRPAAALCS